MMVDVNQEFRLKMLKMMKFEEKYAISNDKYLQIVASFCDWLYYYLLPLSVIDESRHKLEIYLLCVCVCVCVCECIYRIYIYIHYVRDL